MATKLLMRMLTARDSEQPHVRDATGCQDSVRIRLSEGRWERALYAPSQPPPSFMCTRRCVSRRHIIGARGKIL